LLPYTSMVTSCFVWILYGVLKGQAQIWLTNLIEFVVSVYYFVEFTNYAPKSSPTFPGSVGMHIQFCLGIWSSTVVFVIVVACLSHNGWTDAIVMIGNMNVLLTILTFASPLVAVKTVIESQSSESIPWPFTIAALFNCTLWTIVGVVELHDYYVALPAIIGFFLCVAQIGLKLWYNNKNEEESGEYNSSTAHNHHRDMPYPILGTLRQVVMLGENIHDNNNNNNNNNAIKHLTPSSRHSYSDELQLENGHNNLMMMQSPVSDYVEIIDDVPSTTTPPISPIPQRLSTRSTSIRTTPHYTSAATENK